ncbi:gluconokinase [Radiobacillus deserti]|uniref:Gluconate kinase n=1 Tax=Radiobacillus deserti TaxID=2594883 RepID=A0A516KIU2_9BACI|nr:gluconokinase [Radiobacillus deserti]QDP41318.1 gluconate kinase [Radiobacillus deserti]
MDSKIVFGVDIGTTSTKTVAYTPDGILMFEAEKEYPLYSPDPTKKEQDPEEIMRAVLFTLSEIFRKVTNYGGRIIGVGLSSAMHSLLGLDANGRPLTNVITWADQRSAQEVEDLKANGKGHDVYLRTGTPLHPMSPLSKLIWFNTHEPELKQAVHKWVSIKEYVIFRLFGQYVVDYSIASATGLFNLRNLDWDDMALQAASITREQLSKPISTTSILSGINPEVAKEIGLLEEIPFVIGASDGVLANLGVGAIQPGVIACSIGTSGAVRTIVDQPITDPQGRLFCYALTEDKWVVGGPTNNGGIALQWLRDSLFPEAKKLSQEESMEPYEWLINEAKSVPAGAEGLLFLPYLLGERAPQWNSKSKGVFFGLTLGHGRKHMIRSVLEGVLFQLNTVVKTMEEVGISPKEIRANGGFARSNVWCQMMADIFHTPISFPESHQSACFGAATLVLKALGEIEALEEIVPLVSITKRLEPHTEEATIYEAYKSLFRNIGEKLTPDFELLADITWRRNQQ